MKLGNAKCILFPRSKNRGTEGLALETVSGGRKALRAAPRPEDVFAGVCKLFRNGPRGPVRFPKERVEMKHFFATLFLAVFACAPALADQVILKNGDRLTGKILESDRERLIIETEFAGTVTVQWPAIDRISSEAPLFLTLKDAQQVVGPVSPTDGGLKVQTETAGAVSVRTESIDAIRSPARQEAYLAEIERLRDPGLGDLWKGAADVGLSLSKGNSDTTSLAFAFNAARKTTRDRIGVYANSLYASNSTSGASITTANAVRGGVRYDVNLSEKSFVFALGDLEYDEFQNLDLRAVLGGGYGRRLVRSERTSFDVFGGGSFNREFFSTGLNRSSGEVLLGEELTHKISERTSLAQKLVFYPNLSETGEYRLNFDISAVTQLSSWLNWHVSLSDRFLSNPVPGLDKNDVLLTTGLRVTFGR